MMLVWVRCDDRLPFRDRNHDVQHVLCHSVGTGTAFDADFQIAFEARMLTVTARAIASAVAKASEIEGSECRVSVDACASSSPECKQTNEQCGGGDEMFTTPCCAPEDSCIVVSDDLFVCRNQVLDPTGTVADCTLPQP